MHGLRKRCSLRDLSNGGRLLGSEVSLDGSVCRRLQHPAGRADVQHDLLTNRDDAGDAALGLPLGPVHGNPAQAILLGLFERGVSSEQGMLG